MTTPSPRDRSGLPYRGEDRRRVALSIDSPHGRPFVLACLLVLAVAGVLAALSMRPLESTEAAAETVHLLQAASVMVAVAVGAVAVARWHLSGDTPALWVGIAMLLYGIVRLGFAELAPVAVQSDGLVTVAAWVRPGAILVTLVLLARAATLPVVNTALRPLSLAGASLLAVAAIAVVLPFVPAAATLLDGATGGVPRAESPENALGLLALLTGVLAVIFLVQGVRRRRWLFSWMALLLAALTLGELARVFAPPPIEAGLLAREILRFLGLLLGLYGATREVLYTYRDASIRLARSEHTAHTAEERIRMGQLAAEERAHEARSALAAIEGATRTLEHYRERLPSETQEALSAAIGGEIRRLQRLVTPAEPEDEVAPFSLAEMLAPLVANERARGTALDLGVSGDLVAVGRTDSTEQVVQTLLDNARRYAPDSALTLRAERERGWIVLRVEDRGPGVPPEQREAIFRRGVRGDTALDVPGSGLGLYVAAQLMRNQAGEMWVDERARGGASFAVALPEASVEGGGAEVPVQDVQDARQVP